MDRNFDNMERERETEKESIGRIIPVVNSY